MITKSRLGAAAPTLALVLSFAVVFVIGRWLGPSVPPDTPPGPDTSSVAPQPPTPQPPVLGPAGSDTGEPTPTKGQKVVTVSKSGGDPEVVAELPALSDLTTDDLERIETRAQGDRVSVCVVLPKGSRGPDGKRLGESCTLADNPAEVVYEVKPR